MAYGCLRRLTFPIKKWAAAAALAAAAFYLLLSGCDVATQRSFFMTAVVLIAVIVDRRAVTFRTLAVAAMIVLTLAPEALVHPSFQRLTPQAAAVARRSRKPLHIKGFCNPGLGWPGHGSRTKSGKRRG